jgi:hypothetical protein
MHFGLEVVWFADVKFRRRSGGYVDRRQISGQRQTAGPGLHAA